MEVMLLPSANLAAIADIAANADTNLLRQTIKADVAFRC